MTRRDALPVLLLLPVVRAESTGQSLRGKLGKGPDGSPGLVSPDGKTVLLTGDEDTMGVLKDARIAGMDFEVFGKLTGDHFVVNPIHTKAMFVHKDGKRLVVTYWCDVCAIRTYTPGICWCCRDETALDLIEPDKLKS